MAKQNVQKINVAKPKLTRAVKKGTLGAKVMLFFTLVIFFVILSIGSIIYYTAYNSLEAQMVNSTDQITGAVQEGIVSYLTNFEEKVNLLALNVIVQNSDISAKNRADAMAEFDKIQKSNPDIMNVYMGTSKKDMMLMPEQSLPADYDPTGRPWYTGAVEKQELIWTEPYQDASTGAWIVSVAKPVMRNNKALGVVALDIKLDTIATRLGNTKIGKYGYPVLATQTGITMTHPNKDLISKEMPVPELLKLITSHSEEAIQYVFKGETKYASVSYLDKLGWALIGTTDTREISESTNKLLFTILIIGVVAFAVALVVANYLSRQITKNVKIVLHGLDLIKKGDFSGTIVVKSNDEIEQIANYLTETTTSLGDMIRKIQVISTDLSESAQNLAATSEETSASADEVARTVEDIARGASDQARDAENGAVIAQQLSSRFQALSDKTNSMIDSAKGVMASNEVGLKSVTELRQTSEQASAANLNIESVINELDAKTQSIEAILNSISAISVQTNLLALNASIEAARAGEHGRGFAVVADEIRKLAEQSSRSAEEVRVIVTNIKGDSTKTVQSMGEVKRISEAQFKAVENVNASFANISKSIGLISSEIDQISISVEQLSSDKEQIVSSIENISAVSEETAAASEEVSASMDQQTIAVEEVAKAAEKLNEISIELSQETEKFKI
jgi:methyl-accepting chemotaxis protein